MIATRLVSGVAVLCALALVAASAAMNYQFMTSLGKSPINAQILGIVSVAVDILKALLPFLIILAWRARKILFVPIATFMFICFAGFSLMSALGFTAGNRNAVMGKGQAAAARLADVDSQIKRLRTRLKAGEPQTPAQIQAALQALRHDRLWTRTKQCTDATQPDSKIFCARYATMQGRLAGAELTARLDRQLQALLMERKQLLDQGATIETDSQAGLLARLGGLKIEDTQTALTVFLAVLVELGAAFGLYIALSHGGFEKKQTRKKASARKSAQARKTRKPKQAAPARQATLAQPAPPVRLSEKMKQLPAPAAPRRLSIGADGMVRTM